MRKQILQKTASLLTVVTLLSSQSFATTITSPDDGTGATTGTNTGTTTTTTGAPPVDLRTPEQLAAANGNPGVAITAKLSDDAMKSCDDVCTAVSEEWSKQDDQWCTDHGAATDKTLEPGKGAKFQTNESNPVVCPVNLIGSDIFAARSKLGPDATIQKVGDFACAEANRKMFKCQNHTNQQLISHCGAYDTATKATHAQDGIIKFDYAALGTCGTACATSMVTAGGIEPALEQACTIAGIAVTGAEFIQMLKAKTNGEKWYSAGAAVMSGVGVAVKTGAIGLGHMDIRGNDDGQTDNEDCEASGMTAATAASKTSELKAVNLGGIAGVGVVDLSMADKAVQAVREKAVSACNLKKDAHNKKHNTCAAAAMFALVVGERIYNRMGETKVASQACAAVTALMSSTPTVGGPVASADPTAVSGASQRPSGASMAVDASAVFGSGIATKKSTEFGISPQASAATDGKVLIRSNLDKLLKDKAANVDVDKLMKIAENGGGAQAAVSAALGGGGSGSPLGGLAGALAKTAQVGFENPLGVDTNVAGTTMATGGGSPARKGGASDGGLGDLSALFAGGDKAADGGAKSGSQVFRGPAASTDIWHANTDQNIFQIVSDRVGKTASNLGL